MQLALWSFSLILLAACAVGCASRSLSTPSCPVCEAPIVPPENYAEVGSGIQIFHHHGLHIYDECYLVRINSAEMTGGWKNQYRMRVTILEQAKGNRTVGSNLEIFRVSDGLPEEVKSAVPTLIGELKYVFLYTDYNGGYIMDQQDPAATWPFNRKYRGIIRRHNEVCFRAKP